MAQWLWQAVPAHSDPAAVASPSPWLARLRQTLAAPGPWLVAVSFAVYSGHPSSTPSTKFAPFFRRRLNRINDLAVRGETSVVARVMM